VSGFIYMLPPIHLHNVLHIRVTLRCVAAVRFMDYASDLFRFRINF
jgi:hypothetical protein